MTRRVDLHRMLAPQIRRRIDWFIGALAQLGERNTGSVEVSGSIPLGSTKSLSFSLNGTMKWRLRCAAVAKQLRLKKLWLIAANKIVMAELLWFF